LKKPKKEKKRKDKKETDQLLHLENLLETKLICLPFAVCSLLLFMVSFVEEELPMHIELQHCCDLLPDRREQEPD